MSERPIERWNRLRSHGSDGVMEVPSLPLDVDTGFGPVRFAIGSQGQPRLLVPCGAGMRLAEEASAGKQLTTISRYQVSGKWVEFIDVTCSAPALDTVFADLAEEVVHRIAQGKGPLAAVQGTIADFRSLLQQAEAPPAIEDQVLVGLIGELVVLERLARLSPSAINAWTGPFDQRHDFRRKDLAIEVKTSLRADSTSISVSSIEQLTEPAGGALTLVHLKLERSDGGAACVSALVSRLLELGVQAPPLEAALAALGCQDANAPQWNRVRCSVEGIKAYRVVEGFPRISMAHFAGDVLPTGVGGLTYKVDLSVAAPHAMDEFQFASALQDMLS